MVSTRRRSRRGKTEKYAAGDKVEVLRSEGVDIGILVSKDDEQVKGSREVTHWVVSVDGSQQEEVISEKALGRILEAHDSDESATVEKSSTSLEVKKPAVKKTTKAKPKVSIGTSTGMKGKRRINTRATSMDRSDRGLNDGVDNVERRSVPAPRPKKKEGDESVVEVKMLTGTLFIYRGKHHRVEFVRTV